jgi:hypothetical protein
MIAEGVKVNSLFNILDENSSEKVFAHIAQWSIFDKA